MRILNTKTAKQTRGSKLGSVCGSRTESMQKKKNIVNSLAAVINKNKHNAAGNSEKVVHPCTRGMQKGLQGDAHIGLPSAFLYKKTAFTAFAFNYRVLLINSCLHSVAYAEIFHRGFIQCHMVVICIWCALFVTSHCDVIQMFPNQRFGEVFVCNFTSPCSVLVFFLTVFIFIFSCCFLPLVNKFQTGLVDWRRPWRFTNPAWHSDNLCLH